MTTRAAGGTASGARRRAREAALQILYALDHTPAGDREVREALSRYWDGLAEDRDPVVVEYAEALVRGTAGHLEEIDGRIGRVSRNWRLERMARVDRNILRLGTYELVHEPDIPTRVIINEAIEVAKRYGAGESPAFVNGLLDRIAQEVREGDKA